MKFLKRKTQRGFDVLEFEDDYNTKCNLQISSAANPHIWLGVSDPIVHIMCKDARALGLDPKTSEGEPIYAGWCEYPIPPTAHIFSRMHLTPKQSFKLAFKLIRFAIFCRL